MLAADKLRSAVIPPGEEFSFNAIVGDVSAENGFVDSLIIVGDRTEVGVGGGVCQVSTTAFRAAFWAGFPILERVPHSYWVSWYDEPGLDATIYTPNVDFRFRDDTAHYLLIQPEVDAVAGRITIRFFGTRPDRRVEMTAPSRAKLQPAPRPLYVGDATLPAGTIKQVDWAKEGMDVTVNRVITYGDGRAEQDKFVSRYQPCRLSIGTDPGLRCLREQSRHREHVASVVTRAVCHDGGSLPGEQDSFPSAREADRSFSATAPSSRTHQGEPCRPG